MSQERQGNRWLIAIMGTMLQLVLGTVYAWSFFQKPIIKAATIEPIATAPR